MMSGTSVFASNETEESNNATQIEQNSEVTAFESDISRAVSLGIINTKTTTLTMILHVNNSVILYTTG